MKVIVYVEGDTDKRFIEDYCIFLKLESTIEVLYTGGKDKLRNFTPKIKEYNDRGYKVLVIFDTDKNYTERIKSLELLKIENQIDFSSFLFPNDSDEGAIEDLLLEIYNSKYEDVFDCLNKYEQCLKHNPNYKIPIKKGKVFGFLDAVLSQADEDKAKDKKRDFLSYDHWNLNHEYLNPLKNFLLNACKHQILIEK